MCFKTKINIRHELKPTQNFKVESWKVEREREQVINKQLPRTAEDVDKDY